MFKIKKYFCTQSIIDIGRSYLERVLLYVYYMVYLRFTVLSVKIKKFAKNSNLWFLHFPGLSISNKSYPLETRLLENCNGLV